MGQTRFFWEKAKISLPYAYYAATLCKKPEQTYERILRSKMYGRTDTRTEGNLKVPTASGGGPKISKILWAEWEKLAKIKGQIGHFLVKKGPKMVKIDFSQNFHWAILVLDHKMDIFGPKWAIFDSFCPGMVKTRFFWEKAKMSLPYAYYAATLCKKPEQTYERILRSRTDERTDKSEFVGPKSAPRGTN